MEAVAAESRRCRFRIDDSARELTGGAPGALHHRRAISAVNAVDDEPFPDIKYLHACIGGAGVEIAGDASFLTGCSCEGRDIHNCKITPEQHRRFIAAVEPSAGIVKDLIEDAIVAWEYCGGPKFLYDIL